MPTSIIGLLTRDRTLRPPPTVSLPGRPAAVTVSTTADVDRAPPPTWERGPRHEHAGKTAMRAGGGATTEPQPGDEVPTWTREQLVRMNDRFVAAMERAIAAGKERMPMPQLRQGEVKAIVGQSLP